MAPAALGKLTHNAVNTAQRLAILPNSQGSGLIQAVDRRKVVSAAGKLDRERKRLRKGFTVGKADNGGVVCPGQGKSKLKTCTICHCTATLDSSLRIRRLRVAI